jgi:hypothetical protein
VQYRIGDLNIFATPEAEKFAAFHGLVWVALEFPGVVNTVLFIQCNLVRSDIRGDKDHFEIIGRLYESDNQELALTGHTRERHVGKLYIRVYDYPHATRFEPSIERLEWYSDEEFDIIFPDGLRIRQTPSSSQAREEIYRGQELVAKSLTALKDRYPTNGQFLDCILPQERTEEFLNKFPYCKKHGSYASYDKAVVKEVEDLLSSGKSVLIAERFFRQIYDIYIYVSKREESTMSIELVAKALFALIMICTLMANIS